MRLTYDSLAKVAAISMILGESFVLWFGADRIPVGWFDLFHVLQIALLVVACHLLRKDLTQLEPARIPKSVSSVTGRLVQIGLIFSLIGDFANSGLIDFRSLIGLDPPVLFSVPFFAIAHILYIRGYFAATSHKSGGRYRTITLIAWPFVAAMLWRLLIEPRASLLTYLSFPYAFLVSLMALTSLWIPIVWGRAGLLTAVGGFLFLTSDSLIAVSLSRPVSNGVHQIIWITYFIAQSLILRTLLLPYQPAVHSK